MQMVSLNIDSVFPDPNNARKHSEKNIAAIKGSLAKFGQQKPIIVDKKNVVLAGNGTLRAAKEMGWTKINVVVTDLEGFDAAAFALADNRTSELAEWDMAVLGPLLYELKEEEFDIGDIGFVEDFWIEPENPTLDHEGEVEEEVKPENVELYTKKIKAPIYEPKGNQPKLVDLIRYEKSDILIKEIDDANLSNDERIFLTSAANRHNVFDYEQIAEYYCHATPEVKALMEKSALVIIDFDKAIENGFVAMSEEIAEAYKDGE